MPKKKSRDSAEFVLFDVFYDDDTRSSNRKVPSSEVGGLDGDAPARTYLEDQESKIAEKSGQPRRRIKAVKRSDAK